MVGLIERTCATASGNETMYEAMLTHNNTNKANSAFGEESIL
jgi:hypothetical protein